MRTAQLALVETSPTTIKQIQRHVQEALSDADSAVGHAYEAGRLLRIEKERLGNRKFAPWLKQHVPQISRVTAYKWIALSVNRPLQITDRPASQQQQVLIALAPSVPKKPKARKPRSLNFPSEFGRILDRINALAAKVETDELWQMAETLRTTAINLKSRAEER